MNAFNPVFDSAPDSNALVIMPTPGTLDVVLRGKDATNAIASSDVTVTTAQAAVVGALIDLVVAGSGGGSVGPITVAAATHSGRASVSLAFGADTLYLDIPTKYASRCAAELADL